MLPPTLLAASTPTTAACVRPYEGRDAIRAAFMMDVAQDPAVARDGPHCLHFAQVQYHCSMAYLPDDVPSVPAAHPSASAMDA